jgi:tRNA threonylcarbamoyladenosine biosynthesis protein TsaB
MTLYVSTKDQKEVIVALKKDGEVVRELRDFNEWGSQVLLGLIQKILQDQSISEKDLTAIEVDPGPGSFTGLRVGAAVAQAMGFALEIPVNGKMNQTVDLRY